jgi:hypothetical protein
VVRDGDSGEETATVQQLALEYADARRRSDPARLYVQQPRDGELQYATFRYLPEHHFRRAYDQLTCDLEPDGGFDDLHRGEQRTAVYYWLDPRTGATLYHTSAYDDEANPFFGTIEEAEAFFDQQAEAADEPERYAAMSLYKAQTRKIEDATAVLTDQAGIQDFMPDGGL